MKKPGFLFALVVLSFTPFIYFIFHPLLFHTHDGLVHIPRLGAYVKALQAGHFPVRWAGDLNYGYGLPLFNFIYPLPYFIASFFVTAGAGLVLSFKLTLFASYILSGIFMYLFGKAFFKDEKTAFLVAIFYQFAPFRFVELLARASFGEVYTYTFFPLVLFGLTKLKDERSQKYFSLTAIAGALLILSHNSISLVFYAASLVFALYFRKTWKDFFVSCLALFAGVLITAFYWLPAIVEHKYTYGNLFMKDLFRSHFASFFQFFQPNLTNDSSLYKEGVAIQLGVFHEIAIILGLAYLFRKKEKQKYRNTILFGLLLIAGSFFFMQSASLFLWERLSLLRQFQFPWRFLALVTFATSFLSFLYMEYFIKTKYFIALILFVVLSAFFYWFPKIGMDKVDESYYWDFPLNTTYYGETDLIWSAGPAKSYPKSRIEVIGGKATVRNFTKRNHVQKFLVNAENEVQLVSHTQYFPGWHVYVDGKSVPISFQDASYRGEIIFLVPKGEREVKIIFEENLTRLISDVISIVVMITVISIGIFQIKKIRSTISGQE